jgi:hypothetical protein
MTVFVHLFDVFMVMNMSAMRHVMAIMVFKVLFNVFMVMNMPAVRHAMAFMMFHVVCHVLMMVFHVSTMLHFVHFMVFFGVGVLNMVQFSLSVVFCTATVKRMLMIGNVIVVFHDFSLLFMGFSAVFHAQRLTCTHFWLHSTCMALLLDGMFAMFSGFTHFGFAHFGCSDARFLFNTMFTSHFAAFGISFVSSATVFHRFFQVMMCHLHVMSVHFVFFHFSTLFKCAACVRFTELLPHTSRDSCFLGERWIVSHRFHEIVLLFAS